MTTTLRSILGIAALLVCILGVLWYFNFTGSQRAEHRPTAAATASLSPTKAETDGLLYMHEEEKLAHDVYTTLGEKWGLQQFTNIVQSESRHVSQVAELLQVYGIPPETTAGTPNTFTNPTFQTLYTALVAQGNVSEVDALRVGALIEDLDLHDLAQYTDATSSSQIRTTYESLARGSRNHLRAFSAALAARGETYVPKHITDEEYTQILSSGTESGPGAR